MNRYAIAAAALLISGGVAVAQQSTNPPQPQKRYDSSGTPANPESGKPNAASPVTPDATTGQAPRRDDRLQSDRSNLPNLPNQAQRPGEEPRPIPR